MWHSEYNTSVWVHLFGNCSAPSKRGYPAMPSWGWGIYLPGFTRPKKDDSFQMTLNLKSFNTHVTNHHFKMDIWTVIRMMKPGCYMASIDLKDAYYSVPRRSTDQKFLKFEWKGTLYQFLCFPNGLALCSQKFTKLFKPFFSYLRLQGHIVL